MPTGAGSFDIFVRASINAAVPVTYFLMSGNNVVATLSGASGTFEDIQPGCYRLVICASSDPNVTYYCCKDLYCDFESIGCCELKYQFFTDVPNPVWDFGDNTTSTQQNTTHEYTNINTYPGEGTPQVTVTLPWGNNPIQSTIQFPQGIWVGSDCTDIGNISTLKNSVNPILLVFQVLNHASKNISIKGSITMDQNYEFTNCDFCMHPSSRIVSTATSLSFLSGTVLHEAACKTGGWYGVEVQNGTLTGANAIFEGAYNALRTSAHTIGPRIFRLTGCQFYRNYLGINLAGSATFTTFSGNTFGNAGGVLTWPGLAPTPCTWVALINRPVLSTPFAGIHARATASQAAYSVNLPGAATPNVFINLANGIYLQDVNGRIQRCRFENMIPGAYPDNEGDGLGIALLTNNFRTLEQWGLGKNSAILTFNNCRHAIYVNMNPQFAGGNVLLRSFQNRMNVQHGYTLVGGWSVFRSPGVIQHNNIVYTGGHGINVLNSSPDTRLTITQNRVFSANTTGSGILLFNFSTQPLGGNHRVSVVNNIAQTLTDPDGIYGGGDGVEMGFFGNALVENNTVADYARIGIHNSSSPEDDIRCNMVSSAAGLESVRNHMSASALIEYNQTDDSNDGISITQSCNNSTISCNIIGSHDTGLYYDASAETGEQLSNQTSAGNTWIGTYTNLAANNVGAYTNSLYYYRTGEINPAQVSPPAWFVFKTTGVTCGTGCPQVEFAGRTVTDLDTKIANDSLAPGGLSGYLLKRFLYNDLLYYPQLLQNNATMQNFYSSFGSANGGKLASMEKQMADAFILTSQQQSQWNAAQNSLASAFEQLVILDSLVQDGADPANQSAQRDTLEQQISTAQATLRDIYEDNLDARTDSVSVFQQVLNSISPQAQWETNEKTLNEIFLNTAFVDQIPDSIEAAQIRQIAQQCAADGGPAVVRARVWHYSLTGERIEVTCDGVIEREASNAPIQQVHILISPNPAQNRILVQLNDSVASNSRLEIFDATGKLQQVVEVPEHGISTELSTVNLSNGIYFCRLKEGGLLVATAKFSVQH